MPSRTPRTLGQELLREFALLIGAIIVAATTMMINYQVLMTMVVPARASGMNSAPPVEEVEAYFSA